MSPCRLCGHDRLLHDSWGCKMKCGCGVSVIYLAPAPTSDPQNREQEEATIRQGNELVLEADRLAESHIEELRNRQGGGCGGMRALH